MRTDLPARPPVWLADWSAVEDQAFAAALAESGQVATVLGARHGSHARGPLRRRMGTYPTYVQLAAAARRAGEGPVIAWQPLAGVAAALAPGGMPGRLVLVNPLLDPERPSLRQRLVVAGAARAHRSAFLSRAGRQAAIDLGVPADRAAFVPFGVRARRRRHVPSTGEFVLAIGRELRDWRTLAAAAAGLDREVLVVGPSQLDGYDPLRLVRTASREETFALMDRASAIVVPLVRSQRQAGLLVVLDAFAAGRPVIATANPATIDYVTADRGRLVEPGDVLALRRAMQELADPSTAGAAGAAALRAANGELALHRFIAELHELAGA